MTKSTKRVFAMLLTLTLLLLPAGTVATATSLFPGTVNDIFTSNYNELGIRSVARVYFEQREAYLLGTSETIEHANPGVLSDEFEHREAIVASDVEWLSSDIMIDSAVCWDSHAEVIATETVLYRLSGISLTETIVHKLQLGLLNDGRILVIRDGYLENITGFRSFSYIPDEDIIADIFTISSAGSEACLIAVAQNEVGYVEGDNNENKYGDTNGGGWCAAFIAWCADQADVPSAIIPQTTYPPTMLEHYTDRAWYYTKSSGYVPQPGDIFFESYDGTDVDHCGIVYRVDSTYVYTIDGNHSNMVKTRQTLRNDKNILGYGNPNYTTTGHYYAKYEYVNGTYHSVYCVNCDTFGWQATHRLSTGSWYSNDTKHWNQCPCGKKGTMTVHVFEYDSSIGQNVCIICDRRKPVT